MSCALDERDVQLVPLGGAGQTPGNPETQTGTLQGAVLEVRPASVDLGAVTTGFASRARLNVVNSGTAALAAPVVEWAAQSSPEYAIIQNQCTSEIPPGESCEFRVQLVPSRTGVVEASLQVSSAEGPSVRVPFRGEGFEAGNLILTPGRVASKTSAGCASGAGGRERSVS